MRNELKKEIEKEYFLFDEYTGFVFIFAHFVLLQPIHPIEWLFGLDCFIFIFISRGVDAG